MTIYALVKASDHTIRQEVVTVTPPPTPKAGWDWYVVTISGSGTIVNDVLDNNAKTITRTLSNLSGNALKDAMVTAEQDMVQFKALYQIINALFTMNNQIRALNSQAALTKAQFASSITGLTNITDTEFKNYLKGLLP